MNDAQGQELLEILRVIAEDLREIKLALKMDVKSRATRLEDIQTKLGTLTQARER